MDLKLEPSYTFEDEFTQIPEARNAFTQTAESSLNEIWTYLNVPHILTKK
jgi:hypothetical protein